MNEVLAEKLLELFFGFFEIFRVSGTDGRELENVTFFLSLTIFLFYFFSANGDLLNAE